ncbi:MAG: hypothetical protein ABI580_03000 [Burkholderiaceae bacterium]
MRVFFAIPMALLAMATSPVNAQAWPHKPITLVGSDTATMSPDQFAKFLASEIKRWAQVTQASGAKLD